jgi:hypothetical protein
MSALERFFATLVLDERLHVFAPISLIADELQLRTVDPQAVRAGQLAATTFCASWASSVALAAFALSSCVRLL